MKTLRSLAGQFLALCLAFQPPVANAQNKKFDRTPIPPFANLVYHSKDMRDLVERMKTYLAPEEYEFLVKKTDNLEKHEMPKVREVKPKTFELRLDKTVVTLKIISSEKEIYSINGKNLELASLSLSQRLDLITNTILANISPKSALWNFLVPEANADLTMAIAIIGAVLGVLSFCGTLLDKNDAKCEEIVKAATSCVDLTGKLRIKVKETANFFLTQKAIEEKGSAKSPEIAKQSQEACKELGARLAEMEVTEYKAKSSLKKWTWGCGFDRETLVKCQDGLRTTSTSLKGFNEKYCAPEATTATPTAKTNESVQSAEAVKRPTEVPVDVPVIEEVLKKPADASK